MSNPIAAGVEYFIQGGGGGASSNGKSSVTNRFVNGGAPHQQQHHHHHSNHQHRQFHHLHHHHSSQPRKHHDYHQYHNILRKQQEQQLLFRNQQIQEQHQQQQQQQQQQQHVAQVEGSRWHSIVRRMSVGIQRAEDKYNSKGGYYDIDDDEEEDVVMREAAQEEVQISPASFDGFFNLETLPMWTHKRPPGMLGEGDNLPSMDEVAKEGARAAHLAESKSNYFEHPFETAVAPWDQQGATKVSTALVPVNGRPISTPRDLFGPLTVSIRDVDESNTFYLIDLQYGEIKWTVKRNVVDFYDLWVTLKLRSTIKSPPSFPSKVQNFAHAIASLRSAHEQNSIMIHSELTSLDTRNEKRRLELAQYLQELVEKSQKVEDLTGLTDLCEFLEVSGISIVKDMGWKGKEGYLEQKVVTRSAPVLRPIRRYGWVKKWFILRDSYIAFCKDTSSTTPTDVMLLDKEFKYHTSERKQFSSHSVITLAKGSKSIQIRVQKGVDEWLDNLNTVKLKSPWVSQQRFNSFAPIRENAKVKWFVDGHEYFEAVAEAILSAKSDIFIEDWWLSPQLYLRRPPKGNEDYRIDRLLKRKASLDDVKIYIVIYKSMKVALPLNSGHTKHWLQDAHPNIIVQRHSNITEAPFWAHHEKILVIDHRLAFVGGLDLCFGRYDTSDHDLTDYAADGEMFPEIFPGQDYSNPRIQDFVNVRKYALETVDKRRIARMPWHDIHTGMVGRPARDVARHFIERWNFIKTESHKDRDDIPYLLPKGEHIASSDESKFRGTCKVQVVRSIANWSSGISREYSIYKAYMECIQKAKHFIYIENQFFITTTVSKDKLIENNIGEAIVKRITRAHTEKEKFRVIIVIPAAPGFEGDFTVADKRSMALRNVAHYQYQSISRGGNSVLEKLRQANIPAEEYIGFCSLRNWGRIKTTTATPLSSGIKEESTPIVDSSTTNVGRLENNSVVGRSSSGASNNGGGGGGVGGIIRRKMSNKRKKGRPLAAMATKNTSNSGIATEELASSSSLRRPRIQEFNDARMDYVTEQVYIHSKLMIVDDKTVICGSANINDRSQLGSRDSEIATVIEDTDLVDSRMNGLPYKASRFALTLRMQLFKEHLGLLNSGEDKERQDAIVMDPLHDEFYYGVWTKTAKDNTEIYRTLFKCVPDDTVTTFDAHRRFVPDPAQVSAGHVANPQGMSEEYIQTELNKIRGHLVTFPTEYLSRENIKINLTQGANVIFT